MWVLISCEISTSCLKSLEKEGVWKSKKKLGSWVAATICNATPRKILHPICNSPCSRWWLRQVICCCLKHGMLHELACHPCSGAMLIVSVWFQFQCMCCPSEHAGDVFEEVIAHFTAQ